MLVGANGILSFTELVTNITIIAWAFYVETFNVF